MNPREAKFGVAIGDIGMGKSEQTLLQLIRYVQRNQKALIADLQGEYGTYELKSIARPIEVKIKKLAIRDVPLFVRQKTPEIRRIEFINPKGDPMNSEEITNAVYEILAHFKNGAFLIEDINAFIGSAVPKDIIGRIISQRHFSCDIITHYQGVTRIKAQTIWSRINWIRFHKCFDSVEMCREQFGGHYEIMKIAETLVNMEYDKGNTRFYCYVYRSDRKIRGHLFTKDSFIAAIERYINRNYDRVMREYVTERGHDGKKVFKHQIAFNMVRQKLFNDYWGN